MNQKLVLQQEEVVECSQIETQIQKFKETGRAPSIILKIMDTTLDERERDILALRCRKETRKVISKKYGITDDYARTIEKNAWQKIRVRAQLLTTINT